MSYVALNHFYTYHDIVVFYYGNLKSILLINYYLLPMYYNQTNHWVRVKAPSHCRIPTDARKDTENKFLTN